MHMRDLLAIARRYRALVAVTTLLVMALVGMGGSSSASKPVSATTELMLSVDGGMSATDLNQASAYLDREMLSYSNLVTTPVVLDPVIKELRLDTTAQELASSITTTVPTSTTLLDIGATADSAEQATALANSVATHTVEAIRKVSPAPKGQGPSVTATVLSRAISSAPASSMSLPVRLALGLLGGLALSVALVALLNRFDRRIHRLRALRAAVGPVPVVATLPALRRHKDVAKAAKDGARRAQPLEESAREDFRRLGSALQNTWPAMALQGNPEPFWVTVSAPRRGDGSSTVAAGLARSLAESGARVLLVETDAVAPSFAQSFGLPAVPGLAEALRDEQPATPIATPLAKIPGLSVITAGSLAEQETRLVTAATFDLLATSAAGHDVVVLDAAPVAESVDAEDLARHCGGALLVAGLGRDREPQAAAAVERLAAACPGGAVVVANFADRSDVLA